MSDKTRTRLRPTIHGRNRSIPAAGPPPGLERRRPEAGREEGVMLNRILDQAFDHYVFTRVDQILNLAGTNDAGYSKTAREVSAALDQLLALGRALKAQHPELTGLVMDFEALTALESGQAAEIAYRQGLRDSSQLRQAFMTFLQQQ
ncbi:hypothetical protein [Sporomusa termitida]|nr:hypothetical protein [Sporomusa termitida]